MTLGFQYRIALPGRSATDSTGGGARPPAAAFLRRIRPELRRVVAHWTGQYQYTIDQVLSEMIERCRELKLRQHRPEEEVQRDALIMLTITTINFLHDGHHRVAL